MRAPKRHRELDCRIKSRKQGRLQSFFPRHCFGLVRSPREKRFIRSSRLKKWIAPACVFLKVVTKDPNRPESPKNIPRVGMGAMALEKNSSNKSISKMALKNSGVNELRAPLLKCSMVDE